MKAEKKSTQNIICAKTIITNQKNPASSCCNHTCDSGSFFRSALPIQYTCCPVMCVCFYFMTDWTSSKFELTLPLLTFNTLLIFHYSADLMWFPVLPSRSQSEQMSSEPEEVKTPVRVCRAFHKLFGFQYANVLLCYYGFQYTSGPPSYHNKCCFTKSFTNYTFLLIMNCTVIILWPTCLYGAKHFIQLSTGIPHQNWISILNWVFRLDAAIWFLWFLWFKKKGKQTLSPVSIIREPQLD